MCTCTCFVGLSYLSECVSSLSHGLQCLELSQCGLTVKGVIRLMDGISNNPMNANTLHTLSLASNSLKGDEPLVSLAQHYAYVYD